MIKMTIEVSPEQALRVAELLLTQEDAPVRLLPAPTAPIAPVAPIAPTAPAQPLPAPVAPIAPTQPLPTQPLPAPVAPIAPAAVQAAVTPPTAVKKYTMDELSLASRTLVEAGRRDELLRLLQSFTYTDSNGVVKGVQSIRDLPEELYPNFAAAIRQLGGKI